MFEQFLEQETHALDESVDALVETFLIDAYEDDMEGLAEDLGCDIGEAEEFYEELRKRVTSTGDISRVRSRAFRTRRATLTTGLSKAQLKLRARKAAKTRKRRPSVTKKAIKKRAKALKRRKQMGL